MAYVNKLNTEHFAQYLDSVVNLNDIKKITDDLDRELMDSQNVLNDIKYMLNISAKATNSDYNESSSEIISQFLAADVPKLLLADMTESSGDIDYEDFNASLRSYLEDLEKNFPVPPTECYIRNSVDRIDLAPFAVTLNELATQLEKMKFNINTLRKDRNDELERKFILLCDYVNKFTQMVHTKTKLIETNQNWAPTQCEDSALLYDNIICRLQSGINEVTFLLKNRK